MNGGESVVCGGVGSELVLVLCMGIVLCVDGGEGVGIMQ